MAYYEQRDFDSGYGGGSFFRPPSLPWGVKGIIIANVAIFLLEVILSAADRSHRGIFHAVFGPLGLSPALVFGRGFVWQLVTYAFLHDPRNLFHILFNMLFLYWFGRPLEEAWGTRRFLLFYLGGAVFAGLVFCLWHVFDPLTWCIGASGAVMAAMMVYALWFPNQIILLFFIIPMRMRTFVFFVIIVEMFQLLSQEHGVANMAHLGGLLYGWVVARAGPRFLRRVVWKIRARDERATVEDDRRLDEILAKIHDGGMNSLTWGEKRFLKRMGRR